MIEPTMNVMKKILAGLAFANVNNLGEFRAALRQADLPSASGKDLAQHPAVSAHLESPAVAPEFRHAQGA
jgi:hypothetical protein